MAERQLTIYAGFSYTPEFWCLPEAERSAVRKSIFEGLEAVTDAVHFYRIYPGKADTDFLAWCAWGADETDAPAKAFEAMGKFIESKRTLIQPTSNFWGLTKPSTYSRGKSEQDMDPFEGKRATYLVIYPFSKTKEWYLMSMDSRQGMMNEHIKLGKQYFEIKQLLLYSFGLQDHEFVVSYEMEDLGKFSDLVRDLRNTEARRYTLLDTPLTTAVYQSPEAFIG